MAALPLSPQSNNYLTDQLQFQQLSQNYVTPTLATGVTADTTPKLLLDGSGRAYLTGSVNVSGSVVTAFNTLMTLPSYITVPQSYALNATVYSSGAYSNTTILVTNPGSELASVDVLTPGSYSGTPTVTLGGPGVGATTLVHMQALSATLSGNPTGNSSYAPTNTVTLTGGTSTQAAVLTVATTGVYSAAVAAGGSGGTNGTQTVTGTTGTGTKFTASVTVAGGAITAVLSITTAGVYTVNPTSLAAEPVTGASLTGATLTVRMKPVGLTVTTLGDYTAVPASPVAQGSTSGTGAGSTFTMLWKVQSVEVVLPGSGYTAASTATFTGGTPVTAATGRVQTVTGSDITAVTLGKNVSSGDTIIFDGIVFFTNTY